MSDFVPFPKVPRLTRDCVITEKIDGTNASVCVFEPVGEDLSDILACTPSAAASNGLVVRAASRNRWIWPDNDNHGFARWVWDNVDELARLGVGHHFGEWWGYGIQRGYGFWRGERRFSLFNVSRWRRPGQTPAGRLDNWLNPFAIGKDEAPACCDVVPTLYRGPFSTVTVDDVLRRLQYGGSLAAPRFAKPEGVMIYHEASASYFKKTIENDGVPKSLEAA